jgi:hypothetical protein
VPKAKTSLCGVKLKRRDAKIRKDSVGRFLTFALQDVDDLAVIRMYCSKAWAEPRKPLYRQSQRRAIPIDSDHPRIVRRFQDRFAVPARSERRIYKEPPALGREQFYDLK